MDIGGQAPQTDGHGSKTLTGLPLIQPGKWGLVWKEGTLLLSPGQSPVSHFTTSGSQTEKGGVVVVKGWWEPICYF